MIFSFFVSKGRYNKQEKSCLILFYKILFRKVHFYSCIIDDSPINCCLEQHESILYFRIIYAIPSKFTSFGESNLLTWCAIILVTKIKKLSLNFVSYQFFIHNNDTVIK